jgi:hypothetical protein
LRGTGRSRDRPFGLVSYLQTEVVGFFSYSRQDDLDSDGTLSALRDRIQRELRGQLGRSPSNFRLWQDKQAIAPGTLWESEIETGIGQSVFFIPIVTPTAVGSPQCQHEFDLFWVSNQRLRLRCAARTNDRNVCFRV